MHLLKLGSSLGTANDAVDGVIRATGARYEGLAAGAALMMFQKGGEEVKLHERDALEIEPRRASTAHLRYTLVKRHSRVW
jgi:hypothetical protein